MAREVIRSFDSMEELGQFIRSGADGAPHDEVPFRDANGNPLTAEQVLELVRGVERQTGRKLIFHRGERRTAA
jgi:hypothetical protein